MDEILKKLFESEILTEDTKNELQAAFTSKLEESVKQAKQDAHAEVTAALNEQWISERETLINALDAKITESLTEEMDELKTDISRFRDLEAEYAEKLISEKQKMSETVKSDIETLIEQLDTFIEIRLTEEINELKTDLQEVRKNEKGRRVFEAFMDEFKTFYTEDNSVEAKLLEAEQQLEDAMLALEKSEKRTAALVRTKKLDEVLAPLSGRQREVMEAILKSVETPMLEEAYSTYVGRVLKETATSTVATSEKENKVLAEGASKPVISGVVKTGDNKDQLLVEKQREEADQRQHQSAMSQAEKTRLQRLGGMID